MQIDFTADAENARAGRQNMLIGTERKSYSACRTLLVPISVQERRRVESEA